MSADAHVAELREALSALDLTLLSRWGDELARRLAGGGRLLVAGNGGSAAMAQHLAAELTGRFRSERGPLPALALTADTAALTAIGNDYGFDQVFARQVAAHGRARDVLITLSASGQSVNLLQAVRTAADAGMTTWGLTGPVPNLLADAVSEYLAIPAATAATVQECHLVAVHLLCEAIDERLSSARAATGPAAGRGSTRQRSPQRPVRLTVVGDVLLDEDIDGSVRRISNGAPVVVVDGMTRTRTPGGAGLAATLAARDGHAVTLVTSIADDEAGRHIRSELTRSSVRIVSLQGGALTAAKTRIRAGGQTLVMLDGAPDDPDEITGPLPADAQEALAGADAIHVADYGRGIASAASVRAAIAAVAGRIPVVWDPHPLGPVPVPNVTVVTPSSAEARRMLGEQSAPGLTGDIASARALVSRWEAGHVALTRGDQGVVLVAAASSAPIAMPAPFKSAADARGAGDRFASAVAVALGSGHGISESVRAGVVAAAHYIARTPASTAGQGDGTLDAAQAIARVRAAGGTVVATGGCFDLLHRGHIALLQQARQLGDCLIVCINDDDSVRRLKGAPRPLVTGADRAGVLRALECVDAVVIFSEDTPEAVLSALRPDIYVKGGDYAIEDLLERVAVESGGGQVVLVPYLDGRSTSSLIRKARSRDEIT